MSLSESKTFEMSTVFMGYIKAISKGQFRTRALVTLYTSYVRSNSEFGSIIWDPYQEMYSVDIESIQKQSASSRTMPETDFGQLKALQKRSEHDDGVRFVPQDD